MNKIIVAGILVAFSTMITSCKIAETKIEKSPLADSKFKLVAINNINI